MDVVLVTVDSLRADHVGFMDSDTAPDTPAIDSIADDALIFENAYANAPYTRASFPAILTGTYPEMYGGYRNLSEKRPYMPERFAEEGYSTGGFHSNPYLSPRFNYGRGFDRIFSGEDNQTPVAKLRRFLAHNLSRDSTLFSILQSVRTRVEGAFGSELGTPYVPADNLNEQAINWLDDTDGPVFLWVHYMDVHHPYVPHEGTDSEGIDRDRAIKVREKMISQSSSLSDSEAAELRRLYRGEIEFVDQCLADLLEAVERNCGMEETVVGFLADHGEAFGEHDYWGHPDELHDELVRIPFALDIPTKDGDRISTPVSTVDLLPTLMDVHDWEIPDRCVGESVLDYAERNKPKERLVFSQASGTKAMVADHRYKLLRYLDADEDILFDRQTDPSEHRDVSETESTVHNELSGVIEDRLAQIEASQGVEVAEVEMTDEVEQRLEDLGYK
ncbi:sulfatase [Haloarchaeobius salinus]|uniref:sulfatase n=1 Tax=Haloarchaeobius salinus TaxID=1198298 RepID=UPI00210A2645|nr:sulfatase [Haloarchaeobius salinus]